MTTEARRILDANISEKDFMQQVIDAARYLGWKVFHTHDSRKSEPGYPDLTMIRNGFLIFAELKREGKKLTDEQEMWKFSIEGVETRAMQVDKRGREMYPVEYYVWHPSDFEEIMEILNSR